MLIQSQIIVLTRLMEAPNPNPTPCAEIKFGYVPFANTDQAKCLNEEVLPSAIYIG